MSLESYDRKIIHHELIHVGQGNFTLGDECVLASLVPDRNNHPSGEISISHMDNYDEFY